MVKEPNAIVCSTLDTYDMLAAFPTNILHPGDYEPVLSELEAFVKTKNINPEELDKDSDLKITSMNKIFAFFAYIIGRHIREPFFKELVFFLMMYRKCMNELGWRKKCEIEDVPYDEALEKNEFCALNNGEYAPEFSNDFIIDKWPEYVSQYNLEGFKVLGTDIECTKNAVFLVQHFCNWMNTLRYTNSRLAINEDNN
jgi:hypothetical protein